MALPGDAKRSLPGFAFAAATRSRHGLDGRIGAHHDRERHGRDQPHRREVLHGVVGQARHDRRRDGQVARLRDHERVAVRLRLGGRVQAEGSAGAGLVLHDDLPAQRRRQLVAHDPAEDVGAAARRERDDEADRLVGVAGLGQRGAGESGGEDDGGRGRGTGCPAIHGDSSSGDTVGYGLPGSTPGSGGDDASSVRQFITSISFFLGIDKS